MSQPAKYKFRLYVADDAQNGVQARSNLIALCRTYLPDRHEIEVVDVLVGRGLHSGLGLDPLRNLDRRIQAC